MEERYDLDSAELITLKLQEGRRGEELAAFRRQTLRNEDELIVVDALCTVVWLRQMLLEQVPEVFQVFLLEDLTCFVLQKACTSLLSDFEIQ